MHIYGLVGQILSHSYSQTYFENKFKDEQIKDSEYQLFPVNDVSEIPVLISNNPDIKGLNVTIPFKEKIIYILDELDPVAKEIGAVNTIKIIRENKYSLPNSPYSILPTHYLIGYNTDADAFYHSLKPLLPAPFSNLSNTKALILGTGGSAKAIAYTLKKLNIDYKFVSRKNSDINTLKYKDLNRDIIDSCRIIINCTPSGMYPDINGSPEIPYEFLNEKHLLFDLIYNPYETIFLKKGKEKGSKIQNGLLMLYLQAEMSWKIWNFDAK
jgi:shikimate dehydrogenase